MQVEEEEIEFIAIGKGSHGEQRLIIYALENISQRKIVLKNQYFRYSFTLEFYLPVCKDFTYELTDREVRYKMRPN